MTGTQHMTGLSELKEAVARVTVKAEALETLASSYADTNPEHAAEYAKSAADLRAILSAVTEEASDEAEPVGWLTPNGAFFDSFDAACRGWRAAQLTRLFAHPPSDELERVKAERDAHSAAADMIAEEREAWKVRAQAAESSLSLAREALEEARPLAHYGHEFNMHLGGKPARDVVAKIDRALASLEGKGSPQRAGRTGDGPISIPRLGIHEIPRAEESAVYPLENEYFTLVFRGDLRRFKGNPYLTETPFGVPHAAGIGNAFTEVDALQHALTEARSVEAACELEAAAREALAILDSFGELDHDPPAERARKRLSAALPAPPKAEG